MLELGVIRQASAGAFHLLPLGERSLRKLISIVDDEMSKIDAQKLMLPLLTPGELWKTTGLTATCCFGTYSLTLACKLLNQ
jgi:prolyl-tRNA synthetase